MNEEKTAPELLLVDLPPRVGARRGVMRSSGMGVGIALGFSLLVHGGLALGLARFALSYLPDPSAYADEISPVLQVSISKSAPASEASQPASAAVEQEHQRKPDPPVRPEPNDPAEMQPTVFVAPLNEEPEFSFLEEAETPIEFEIETFFPSLEFAEEESSESTESSIAARDSMTSGTDRQSSDTEESNGKDQKSTGVALVKKVAPVYPESAREQELEGTVMLLATISKTGVVSSVQVSKGSGFSTLDRAALEAVRKWTFTPARRHGVPSSTRLRIPVSFELK